MKKSSHPSTSKKKASPSLKEISPLDDPLVSDNPVDETNLAVDQFAVAAREDEATSSGGRVEPIQPDEEGNAESLIEEGLQGYMHGSLTKPRKTK
jgi:hypothetical protein